jgi:hypothetical protein
MTPSIPASQLVSVTPGVLGAGGNPLSLNAVFLTADPSVPIGTVMPFSDQQDVANFFGPASVEAERAGIYFSGFANADSLPGTLIFAQYNTAAVAGYLRGESLAGVALTTIQGLSGTLTFSVDGVSSVSAAINLASASSFSNAATLITAGIAGGTPGNAAVCTYDSQRAAFVITSSTTGASSSVGFPTVDSLATGLGLTPAAGAVLSPGAVAAVPATLMASIVALTQNWFTFTTIVEPNDAAKELFAAWVQTTNDSYLYVASDSNVAALSANASSTFGAIVAAAADDGVLVNYDTTGGDISAFVCGMIASIDFNETAGRITLAYKSQAGLTPQITGATQANNLIGNGYNFYGQYATPNQAFQFYQNGAIAGRWLWTDAYVNQRLLNSALQLALMELLANTKSVPYNNQGYGLIRAAAADPINTALAFGAIQPGVTLSAAQAAEVNVAAGAKIDGVLSTTGYYLQILDPGAIVRGGRGSPKCTLWYTDGGSVQKINLASIDVQ